MIKLQINKYIKHISVWITFPFNSVYFRRRKRRAYATISDKAVILSIINITILLFAFIQNVVAAILAAIVEEFR